MLLTKSYIGLLRWGAFSVAGLGMVSASKGEVFINQVGYVANEQKLALVESDGMASDTFEIVESENQVIVFSGALSPEMLWQPAPGIKVRIADFSALQTSGKYRLRIGEDLSGDIHINDYPFEELTRGSLRYYYFSRASTALDEEYALQWARPAGHPDTNVIVHASAASAERPAGTIISAPKGWYDAGDFNKYVVNSGISTYTLLLLYELNKDYFANLDLGIPESGDGVPDLLDEIRWNLDWMLAMQDPNDGGVYHKLTTLNFSDAVMPHEATAPRYVVQKSVTATLDFAAVMAFAARVFEELDPAFSRQALDAAVDAYQWALENPAALFIDNPPGVSTGTYGDANSSDEQQWAAAELFIATGDSMYESKALESLDTLAPVPGWPEVQMLAVYSLALFSDNQVAVDRIIQAAEIQLDIVAQSGFRTPMQGSDYYWGSNSVAANKGMLLSIAERLTGRKEFREATIQVLDYILGRNPLGVCFVTGFGERSPMHPHHRVSLADGILEPVPGMLVGGPNPDKQDGCPGYPDQGPAMSWIDSWCSYASNEVTINWNAPLTFVAGSLQSTADPLRGLFGAEQSLGAGFWSTVFGVIWRNNSNDWLYHLNHGWLFVVNSGTGAWLYSGEALGWIWTSPVTSPVFYAPGRNDWFYYLTRVDMPPALYWYASDEWESWN